MYTVLFSEKALKFLEKMDKEPQKQIIKGLEKIRLRPEDFLIKLIGDSGYKLRIGDHRLIIDLNKEQLQILVIELGHRKNIYKK